LVLAEQIGSDAELFSANIELAIPSPGAYLLCGYLTPDLATASVEMTVGPSEAEQAATESAETQAKNTHEAEVFEHEVEAQQAAEANAQRLAEQTPVRLLHVKAVAHPGNSASKPGHTTIAVTTSAYTHVTIVLNHHAGIFRYQAPGTGGIEVAWSCRHPDLTYRYVVTAVRGSGSGLRRSGSFTTVSTTTCAALKVADERRSAARRRQEAREAEEERHEKESPLTQEREYCEKVLGGNPVGSTTIAGHVYLNCHIFKTETHPAETIIVSESTIRG
jgi:hypothetical protein